jgi:hypothetical protein
MAGPGTAPTGRSRGRIAGAILSTAVVAALVLAPASTLARGGSGTPAPAWISLASVNGSAASTRPMLGSTVAFATGYPSTTKNPWISLTCTENGTTVYVEGNSASGSFMLGGYSSVWLSVGGTATCTAELGDLYWKGGHEYYTYLATTSFSAN